eukprot:3531044-Pyramimonas_sp.AAC.1
MPEHHASAQFTGQVHRDESKLGRRKAAWLDRVVAGAQEPSRLCSVHRGHASQELKQRIAH